jgi:hypothetical protein
MATTCWYILGCAVSKEGGAVNKKGGVVNNTPADRLVRVLYLATRLVRDGDLLCDLLCVEKMCRMGDTDCSATIECSTFSMVILGTVRWLSTAS